MGFAALTSGGKDSILSVQKAIDQGIQVTHLVTVRPENPDSFMFHSSNLDAYRLSHVFPGSTMLKFLQRAIKKTN